jgi:hypothetical protein
MTREFELVKISYGGSFVKNKKFNGSVISASSPGAAAAKAFNLSCKANKNSKKCQSTVVLKEASKEYKYKIVRIVKPTKVSIAGKEVLFKFQTTISSIKK